MYYNSMTFRASPVDRAAIDAIRIYFLNAKGRFIDISTAIRFAIQEAAHLINKGHSFERHD